MMISLLLISTVIAGEADHEAHNPIYRDLIESGLVVGTGAPVRLPEPVMPDGLTPQDQRQALNEVIGRDYTPRVFVRASAVAPYILRLRDREPSSPEAPTRGMDVYFVAHGELETIASPAFLDRNLDRNREGGEAIVLTPEQLGSRGIEPALAENGDRESFTHLRIDLLDRVRLGVLMHSIWSQSADSIVVAGQVDRRFLDDAEFPNQWSPISGRPGRREETGPPRPYEGAGYYVKITRLHDPEGALFVEAHVVFTEPNGWFDGANLLRSKLPPVVQSEVRDFRRELARAGR